MFRTLANLLGGRGNVFIAHPHQLIDYLETVWANRGDRDLLLRERPGGPFTTASLTNVAAGQVWRHLIYAYMIENTRADRIFRRVLQEYVHGERLGIAPGTVQLWLRNTESLFFRDPPFESILSLTSEIRPDRGAIRRNAYYRMFGMDLNHGADDNRPYAYRKAETANRDFVTTFEALLREIWVGIKNVGNSAGANPSDRGSILNHAARLQTMLTDRRQQGTLAREEFMAVATMSWYHLALEDNSPIVVALEADATSESERLRKIGDRVGLPAHRRSEDYFRLAEPMANVLTTIETGDWTAPASTAILFAGALQNDFFAIITHWAGATGRSPKAGTAPVPVA